MARLPGMYFVCVCALALFCLDIYDEVNNLHDVIASGSALLACEKGAFRAYFAAHKWLLDDGRLFSSEIAAAATWLGRAPRNQTLAYVAGAICAEMGCTLDTRLVGRAFALGLPDMARWLVDEKGLALPETLAGGQTLAELLLRQEDADSLEWLIHKKGPSTLEIPLNSLGHFDVFGHVKTIWRRKGDVTDEFLIEPLEYDTRFNTTLWLAREKGSAIPYTLTTGETPMEFLLLRGNIALLKRLDSLVFLHFPRVLTTGETPEEAAIRVNSLAAHKWVSDKISAIHEHIRVISKAKSNSWLTLEPDPRFFSDSSVIFWASLYEAICDDDTSFLDCLVCGFGGKVPEITNTGEALSEFAFFAGKTEISAWFSRSRCAVTGQAAIMRSC